MRRWVSFGLFILVGLGFGLLYGWYINPVTYQDTSLQSLRMDYQADYVLMIAETYSLTGDPITAARSLLELDNQNLLETTRRAILFAEQAGYHEQDIGKMRALQTVLEGLIAPLGTPMP